ncbi:MAG: hypothetical protein M3N13_08415 [Candidatus Eremiobacteraeota bacterium]|nr:hypothetical protein [Candidatus Eremiobacteraeota bacterium]
MRPYRLFLSCALLVGLAACNRAAGAQAQATLPSMLIDDRGVVMPLEQAAGKIDYRPWVPPNQILKFAVIPPLGDADTPKHRGIAIEYEGANQAMLLSEWPKQKFSLILLHNQDVSASPCTIAHYKADGIAWTTRGRLAMTLQPDGNAEPKTVEKEARRLIAAGACQ